MSKLILLLLISFQVFFVLKNDCIGQPSITWQRLYNGPLGLDDVGRDICESSDGYFFIVGLTGLGNTSIYILKINAYGDTIWSKIISGQNFGIRAYAVTSSNDGGSVITGSWDSAFTLKLNSYGDLVWQKFYGGDFINCYDIIRTNDSGYIACGSDFEGSTNNGFIVKINSTGDLQWQKNYPSSDMKIFRSIITSLDGGYVLSGTNKELQDATAYAYILKIDSIGNELWEKRFIINNKWTYSSNIVNIPSGYLVGGTSGTSYPMEDTTRIFFIKTDFNGNIQFTKIFNTNIYDEYLYFMQCSNDNRYIFSILGTQSIDSTCKNLITDSLGNIIKEKVFTYGSYAKFNSILPLSNGDILFVGAVEPENSPWYDIYTVRTDSLLNAPPVGIESLISEKTEGFYLYQNYPNPFNATTMISFKIPTNTYIKLSLYDILGRELETIIDGEMRAGSYRTFFNASNYSSGIYYLSLYANNIHTTRKLILIK